MAPGNLHGYVCPWDVDIGHYYLIETMRIGFMGIDEFLAPNSYLAAYSTCIPRFPHSKLYMYKSELIVYLVSNLHLLWVFSTCFYSYMSTSFTIRVFFLYTPSPAELQSLLTTISKLHHSFLNYWNNLLFIESSYLLILSSGHYA